ncbi:MAG: cold-shock protein [Fluviicola sp.]
MADTFNKKEKEKKKLQKRKEKQMRKEARKEESKGGGLENMMAYVDENGVIRDTPPDENAKKKTVKAENIEIGVPKREKIEEDPIHKGKVNFFDSSKGYGFIKDEDGESYFVHINRAYDDIAERDEVEFEIEKGPRGWVAFNVTKK